MTIFKETEFSPTAYIAKATLESGVEILIREDGSADGNDGKTYYNVSQEVEDTLVTVGWTADSNETVVL